jgi:CDP-diacylglycerol--glycerol-3-phosphate 3-phosphatidyltransferase
MKDFPEQGLVAAGLFILASITDYFDGYLARKLNAQSILGKLVDPVADKILVTSTLVMMIPTRGLSPILVILLLSRDTLIGGLRAVAASENIIIAASPLGKWKTALQMVAIPAALINTPVFGVPLREIGDVGLWFSVVLSFISGFDYLKIFNVRGPVAGKSSK